MDCGLPGFSVHGIFQARILGQVAISYSRGSLGPSNQTHVSCVGVQILYCCTAWEAQSCMSLTHLSNLIFLYPSNGVDTPVEEEYSKPCFSLFPSLRLCFLKWIALPHLLWLSRLYASSDWTHPPGLWRHVTSTKLPFLHPLLLICS